ncbi:MAG: transketolase [Chloroflexi bacterium]|nr:transketolase [Chloroflexota bacterium]MCL5075946.1 transketolase [Chloroflexota bacterium]
MAISEEVLSWQDRARRVAWGIRKRVLEHTIASNGGYLSQACSSAEILATLYIKVMKLGPSQAPMLPPPFPGVPGKDNPHYFTGAGYNGPKAPDLDRFFLSPAHYALALYATLIEVGRMAPEGLAMFNKDGSSVEMIGAEHSPGMEVTCGSLGQTLSQAAGIALARKLHGETGRVWVFMSDGEFQSGQTWEAMQVLPFYNLDNVGVYVDVNGQQCDGKMEDVMRIEPLRSRAEAFGARVFQVDGHDVNALAAPAEMPTDGRPLVILAYTNPCQGIGLLEARRPRLHYVRFKDEEERAKYAAVLAKM